MKFKCGESLLLALFMLFIELIKRCSSSPSEIELVDPLIIKIDTEKFENISLLVHLDNNTDDRSGKRIQLVQTNDSNIKNEYISKDEKDQDKTNQNKIEFTINQKDFENKYGKYNLYYFHGSSQIPYKQTILIYTNDIELKNPKNKYCLTGQGVEEVKYDFLQQIVLDEINRITYIEKSDNKTYILSKNNYTVEGKTKLVIKFSKKNSYSSYIFDIYPEYDKNVSNDETQRFYLHFQDYLLKNDAIYINKNNYTNLVPFNLTFRYTFVSNQLSIPGYNIYNITSLNNDNKDYEITINLGRKTSPGKVRITYNGQERELFYILYVSNFEKCYNKAISMPLTITMEWITEMEYDHFVYFNDTTSKLLGRSNIKKDQTTYTYYTLNLNSGIFSLKSTIAALNYSSSYNPVDNRHLFFFLYPNIDTFDKEPSFIFTHNSSKQYVNISSTDQEAIKVLDEIILRKDDGKNEITVSKTNQSCFIDDDNNIFYCDLKDIIYNYGEDSKIGNYSIIYKSRCGENTTIKEKVVTIGKGIGLSDISPRWINQSNVSKSEVLLTYDDNIEKRKLVICFNKGKIDDNSCDYPVNNYTKKEDKVRVFLTNMEKGTYYVKTSIPEEGIKPFTPKDLSFRVSDPKINFKFNHHYFVINNDNPKNKLIITVKEDIDIEEEFNCTIVENTGNKTLNHSNCSIFEYQIDKPGTFKFNYTDKEGFLIPINDFIVVVSTYSQLFKFNERFCYYYRFNISIDIWNSHKNGLEITVFLKKNEHKIPLDNIDNKYTYKDINSDFIDNQGLGYDFYISEGWDDEDIYLYKSKQKVNFTQLKTQEYIIDPNRTIVFFDVKCDLNSSSFIIKKLNSNYQNSLIYWKYDLGNKYLYCNISGEFYKENRFRYYYYQIDYNNITNIDNESELYQTFVSRRLNDTNFDLKIADSNDYITITNKEHDFYFPLISGLNTLQRYRNPENYTSKRNELTIDDDASTIRFDYKLAINDVLTIKYLVRDVNETLEKRDELGNSIYYFFNKDNIINGTSLIIDPKIFAFNIPKEEDYKITILYSEENQKNYQKDNLTNCTNSTSNNLEEQCFINYKISPNKAQNVTIKIYNDTSSFNETINFIYYHLDDDSKQYCQTMDSNMNNITLVVDIPNANLKDRIKLYSPDTDIVEEKRNENYKISFILNGNNIDPQETNLRLYTDDEELDHWFTLQELGINILPKYDILFDNNKNVSYLLPEDNQVVKVKFFLDRNKFMEDIVGFKIKGENNINNSYKVGNVTINGESYALNLIFNLSSVNRSEKNYILYYTDRCGKDIETDLIISLLTFNFQRKYFVLKNNYNTEDQILRIEGHVDDKIQILVYKNGEHYGEAIKNNSNYYLNFSQSSQGDYTFIVLNDGLDSSINDVVYVKENLEDILSLKQGIPNCMFSNDNKSAIKDFSYTITNINTKTNFSNFESYFSQDKNNFKDILSYSYSANGNDKTFSITYSNETKNNINLNNELYICLTENNDTSQPIYVFSYRYTKIKLHSDFTKFIYTDADYISFEMSCKLNNMIFELSKIGGNTYPIICADRGTNDISNNIFKCYLSSDNNSANGLLLFGKDNLEYQNYHIKYSGMQITNEPLFISQDIYSADFKIVEPSQIGRNVTISLKVTTEKTYFYFNEVNEIVYYNSTEENKAAFKYNIDNYITFDLYIENHVIYTIRKICRKPCIYCREENELKEEDECQILDKNIESNTPEVYFKFDKHYIALENSTYRTDDKDNIHILTIESSGDSKDKIDELKYSHFITPTNKIEEEKIDINKTNNKTNIYILPLSKGKYTFHYLYKDIPINISDIVLVTDYDYEMFDYSDLSNKCIFYDLNSEISGILVSIIENPNYPFKNDIVPAYLFLEFNGKEGEFSFNGEKGYKISDQITYLSDDNFNYVDKIYFREENRDFIFTTFNDIHINTIRNRNSLSEHFYYKDNIVLKQQYCESNNIYIKSSSNLAEYHSLLKCDYEVSNQTQYCEADKYKFLYKTNDHFYLYFGIKKLISSFSINISNSIKDSNFSLSYDDSILRIYSNNFDMGKLYRFNIDNQSIYNDSFKKDQNSISHIYSVNNGTESYITELMREDHPLDRNITIKIKKVNLKIESQKCPPFMVKINGDNGNLCVYCAQKVLLEGDASNIWYQNGECVNSCNGVDYFIYDQVNHYCLDCKEQTYLEGRLVCGCLEGTVKNPLDSVCYLPEDPKIKEALNTNERKNIQCYLNDGITNNYCKNETTSHCDIISISGADFPFCYCKDGYTGKYCENKNDEINLNNNIDSLLNLNNSDKIDESDPNSISKIRGIIYFIEKDTNNYYEDNIRLDKIDSLLEASIKCIDNAINEKHNYPQIYDVIEISIHFLVYKIKNSRRLRLLQEQQQEDRNKLKYILENAHYLNYLANIKNTNSIFNIQSDGLNLLSFISYKADSIDKSFKSYVRDTTYNSSIVGYIDLNDSNIKNSNENAKVVLTIFNRNLFNLDSLVDGLTFNFSISNYDINLKNFYAYIYSPNIYVNYDLANYYQAKNINIYDKYDICFTDACFTSENFEFDLTQKYRKKYVFQRWSLDSNICRYHSFENESNNIEISCQTIENFGKMSGSDDNYIDYATLNFSAKKDCIKKQDKVYNLPMKCKKTLNSENYAFWIFLIICILEIIYIIGITILTLGSLRRVSIRKGLRNDGLFYIIPQQPIKNTNDDVSSNHSNPLKKTNDEYYNSVNDIYEKPIGSYNKTLLESIFSNFKELHPLSVFCRASVISPLIMNSWFLVFNTLCLFGFNALIYYEALIEKRIYDKKRNYFDYPMRKEFHKIILSILLQIALTVIIKAIVLVFLDQYEDLESKLRKCKRFRDEINNDIILRHDNFQEEMLIRRLIGGFLMTAIIIFFFYYSVVFCEVYIKTQRNLVFSWIWSLFWEWVIFAPIYIVIISVLENKKADSKDPLIYYLKRLFVF